MKKFTFLCIAIAVLSTGCSAKNTETVQNRAAATIQNGATKTYKRQPPYRQYNVVDPETDMEANNESATQRAKRISVRLGRIESLDNATVVITGNTAIVGIEVAGEPDESAIIKIKRRVEKEVKAEDKGIDHVAVTAAPDLVKRILDMNGSEEERPRFNERVEDVITRLTPVV